MAKDYYDILGVSRSASQEDIKVAFRKLAHQFHPDKAGGNTEKFKEINAAYQVLSSVDKRKQYDQFGASFEQARAQGGFSGFENFRDFADYTQAFRNGQGANGQRVQFDFGNLGEMFGGLGDLFGFGGGNTSRSRGGDLQIEIAIPFREAVFGTTRELTLERERPCSTCQGSGAEPGSKVSRCRTCGGQGRILRSIGLGFGLPTECPDCGGAGSKADQACKTCRGRGAVTTREKLSVKIPAGIDDGQAIHLGGQGQAGGKGRGAGDLYVRVRVVPDPRFRREGDHVRVEAEIPFTLATLGGVLKLETLDGEIALKIPEGTQSGKTIRVRERGVPNVHGHGRGDLLVDVRVKTPTRISRQQRKLLEELRESDL